MHDADDFDDQDFSELFTNDFMGESKDEHLSLLPEKYRQVLYAGPASAVEDALLAYADNQSGGIVTCYRYNSKECRTTAAKRWSSGCQTAYVRIVARAVKEAKALGKQFVRPKLSIWSHTQIEDLPYGYCNMEVHLKGNMLSANMKVLGYFHPTDADPTTTDIELDLDIGD